MPVRACCPAWVRQSVRQRADPAAARRARCRQARASTGDGLLATFEGPARAIRCALSTRDAVTSLGISIRAGIHAGEIEYVSGDIVGIGVHLAARVVDVAAPGEVLVTRTVTELVAGSGIVFEDRGTHTLKGIADRLPLFAAISA